jgi:20S proteasome alpha/beta subunit
MHRKYDRIACLLTLYSLKINAVCSFLGSVDLIGTAFTENFIATGGTNIISTYFQVALIFKYKINVASGYGAHLALPLMRRSWRADMSEGEARALLEQCATILFYRDCRTINKVLSACRILLASIV